MAPSSKSEKDKNKEKQRQHDTPIVKLLNSGRLSGQLSANCFRTRYPRVSVPLKTVVSESTLQAGHIFLGFTKCGRYVLSYTRDYMHADDAYIYHLYWWEFNLRKMLKLVSRIHLFADHQVYSDLRLAICEWYDAESKLVIFGYSRRIRNLLNLIHDVESADTYICIVSMPPATPCLRCKPSSAVIAATATATAASSTAMPTEVSECLDHGFVLNTHYQVVHPFPMFQPSLQLKRDSVILLNTSYSLVACAISLCEGGRQGEETGQILYKRGPKSSSAAAAPAAALNTHVASSPPCSSASCSSSSSPSSSSPHGSSERLQQPHLQTAPRPATQARPSQSRAAMRAREFAANIFRRAQTGGGGGGGSAAQDSGAPWPPRTGNDGSSEGNDENGELKEEMATTAADDGLHGCDRDGETEGSGMQVEEEGRPDGVCLGQLRGEEREGEEGREQRRQATAATAAADPPSSPQQEASEPGYVSYTRLKYCFPQQQTEDYDDEDPDDKFQLLFTVTDLKGNKLQLLRGPSRGRQFVSVEQLTLDFEYVINEVIRNDAEWSGRFFTFSDYDVFILEMCPETNIVVINIGLILLAFASAETRASRPESYHTSLQVSWDLNTGECRTLGVDELKEMKGQKSRNVWSRYRHSGLQTLAQRTVQESSARQLNCMTNEALHRGTPLQILADKPRGTVIYS